MQIEVNGTTINYEVTGSGDPLVLLHGTYDSSQIWYNQIPEFSQSYRVLNYDMRGFGPFVPPEGDYSEKVLAQDLYLLLRALEIERAYLLCHSLGCEVGLRLTLIHPTFVKALILAHPVGVAQPRSRQEVEQIKGRYLEEADRLEKEGWGKIPDDRIAALFSPEWIEKNRWIVERYRDIQTKNSPQGYARFLRGTFIESPASPTDLKKIVAPVMIIVGENDPTSDFEAGRALQSKIPQTQVKLLPTGHLSHIEDPERFNDVVWRFLSKLG
ncbi:MAG: alpha/beta hydrolase [Candidatus Tectomicrobia bacterium]|nr:alpha/beta hydrolase [Candidatus Tectomicrobia bacterium]